MINELDRKLFSELTDLKKMDKEDLVQKRYEKYRHIEGERAPKETTSGEVLKWAD